MFIFEDTLFIEESLIAPCMSFIYTYDILCMFFFLFLRLSILALIKLCK